MNGPEKKVVYLAFCLLVVGLVVRFLPWGLPAIESFQVGDPVVVSLFPENEKNEKSSKNTSLNTDKLINKNAESHEKRAKRAPKAVLPVHINTASVDMLCALKGVGPKLAEKIIAYREASGPFKNEKDLQKVPGIGKKKLEGLLPGVIFD